MKLSDSMRKALLALGLVGVSGCSQQEVVAQLRSLSASEDAVFICRDGNGNGHPFSDCPDRDLTDDADKARQLSVMALVSQTVTDEVAVVNASTGSVVDVDPGTPGFGFLRVGGRPVSMAATPGGTATFVATADVGHNGLFALSTNCLGAPEKGELPRDLTTWPACRLDETPGEITVVVVPEGGDECSGPYTAGDAKWACSTNLHDEAGPKGRRKIIVSFPDSGTLKVLDAQWLLDQEPGTFPGCDFKSLELPLRADVPAGMTQTLPPDLETTCAEVPPLSAPKPSAQAPRPAGFALADERLYVADRAAPVIHVLDVSDACHLSELPSLLPMSLREPERVVTTRRVAASPLTPSGKRFVYAIDSEDQPNASVMVFDVSPGVTNPTPIVRGGSPELPGEKPDRITLDSAARDVAFAYRDIPYADPVTGVATFGNACNPAPGTDASDPGALARPSADLSLGARPGLLRGLFGFILQTNGKIGVIDVEDFDAACRRPENAGQPFRGCQDDTVMDEGDVPFYAGQDENKNLFVTNEVSCRVVEPHRIRSARPIATNAASVSAHSPYLRSFPQFTLPASASSVDRLNRPRLLAVPYESYRVDADKQPVPAPADVLVGSTRYVTNGEGAQQLATNPNGKDSELLQTQHTLVLPPLEPRAYATDVTTTLTYEGSYAGKRTAGFLAKGEGETLQLSDATLSFCAAGVYDQDVMAGYAQTELGLTAADAKAFAPEHADYVQITSALLPDDDQYWSLNGGELRDRCKELFGATDTDALNKSRDFRVRSARANGLVLEPRGEASVDDALHCFPTAITYELRAGNHWVLLRSGSFRHDVVEGTDRACVRSCNPLRKWDKSRVFEISSQADHCRGDMVEGDPLEQRVGCAKDGEVACVYDQGEGANGRGVSVTDDAARCIFSGLTERFALYRGRVESQRDSVFTWQTSGGFASLIMSLNVISNAVSPQSLQYLGQVEELAVVDGASLGLTLFSLDTFSVVKPSPFY